MTSARPLRVLLVANDGFSAGHVARTIAIARGLGRQAARRKIPLAAVLATTSEAHALLAAEPLAIVRLPAPAAARRAGLSDAERRRLVRATLDGAITGLGPDLIVVDTFPSGPHGELAGLHHRARRALIRRSVPDRHDDALTAGLGDYDLAILAGDPGPVPAVLPIPTLHVPPITLAEEWDTPGAPGAPGMRDASSAPGTHGTPGAPGTPGTPGTRDREAARRALALPSGRTILVAAGGGGDTDAGARAQAIAEAILRVAPEVTPVLALGPLAPDPTSAPGAPLRWIRVAPLPPVLAAFDGAFAPAGYNTAHELARARVPAALFAQPRPFDDQGARAARFAQAGLACELANTTDEAIAGALTWMQTARMPVLASGGADRAAEALIDLATGSLATGSLTTESLATESHHR